MLLKLKTKIRINPEINLYQLRTRRLLTLDHIYLEIVNNHHQRVILGIEHQKNRLYCKLNNKRLVVYNTNDSYKIVIRNDSHVCHDSKWRHVYTTNGQSFPRHGALGHVYVDNNSHNPPTPEDSRPFTPLYSIFLELSSLSSLCFLKFSPFSWQPNIFSYNTTTPVTTFATTRSFNQLFFFFFFFPFT